MRMYDPRVGRFFSGDPLMLYYAYMTPYQFASNMPITCIDIDGMEGGTANGSELPAGTSGGTTNTQGSLGSGTSLEKANSDLRSFSEMLQECRTANAPQRKDVNSIQSQAPGGTVRINETAAPSDQFSEGISEGRDIFVYKITSENPFLFLCEGIESTIHGCFDIIDDGIDYWKTPRNNYETVSYLMDASNYSATSRAIVHAGPRQCGQLLGGSMMGACVGGYFGGARITGGRYFSIAASEDGIAGSSFKLKEINKVGGIDNCVNCAMATDNMLSGTPASALESGPSPISILEQEYKGRFSTGHDIAQVRSMVAEAVTAKGF